VDPVACTRFCEQPDLPAIGGTKNPDIEAIVGLAPDLVIVNDEENRIEDADALVDAGLGVHSMSPRSVADVGPAVVALTRPRSSRPTSGNGGSTSSVRWHRVWHGARRCSSGAGRG